MPEREGNVVYSTANNTGSYQCSYYGKVRQL